MVGSAFITTQEVQWWMEAAWQELYTVASIQYEDLLVQITDLTAVAGTGTLTLPPDVKRLRSLRIKLENFLTPLSLREIQNLDRVNRQGRPKYYWMWGPPNSTGMGVDILPPCDATYTITCYYQPALGLVDACNITSIPQLAGWDEYVVLSAAIKAKDKEESSVSTLVGERAALFESMKSSWTPMDTSEASRVVQLAGRNGFRGLRAYDYQGPDDDF
jgi:hypothetical protein